MAKKTAVKPAAEKSAGEVSKPLAPAGGAAGAQPAAGGRQVTDAAQVEGAPAADTDQGANAATIPAAEGAAALIDTALLGEAGKTLEVVEGTGGIVMADPDREISGMLESRPSGWVITCIRRDRGLWRAGRFWSPEPTTVGVLDLSSHDLEVLRGEPLLLVEEVA